MPPRGVALTRLRCVLQLLAGVLLVVQLVGLGVAAGRHYSGDDVRPVDVFTPLILFVTIVSHCA